MLIPEQRGMFFDVVVALVRKVVCGEVWTGYLGYLGMLKRGGLGKAVCSSFWGG